MLSYFYVDQPVVWFLLKHQARDFIFLKHIAHDITLIVTVFVFLIYVSVAFFFDYTRTPSFIKKSLIVCNAIVITCFLKEGLKFIFGRFWAATFICNNASLVKDHVYGFNWFHGGFSSLSFPSGHCALIAAFSTSMWCLFPKYRLLWILLALLVTIGQVGMYYHFVSDVIAGTALGYLVAIHNYHYLGMQLTNLPTTNGVY